MSWVALLFVTVAKYTHWGSLLFCQRINSLHTEAACFIPCAKYATVRVLLAATGKVPNLVHTWQHTHTRRRIMRRQLSRLQPTQCHCFAEVLVCSSASDGALAKTNPLWQTYGQPPVPTTENPKLQTALAKTAPLIIMANYPSQLSLVAMGTVKQPDMSLQDCSDQTSLLWPTFGQLMAFRSQLTVMASLYGQVWPWLCLDDIPDVATGRLQRCGSRRPC